MMKKSKYTLEYTLTVIANGETYNEKSKELLEASIKEILAAFVDAISTTLSSEKETIRVTVTPLIK